MNYLLIIEIEQNDNLTKKQKIIKFYVTIIIYISIKKI